MDFKGKRIFLFDGVGAAQSALFTGLLLPHFTEWTGLPDKLLYCLAMLPLIYCIYSLTCFWFMEVVRPRMLLAIIIANILYGALSASLIFALDSVTIWGQILLAGEIVVLVGVVAIELKIYQRISKRAAT